jgi:pimeloyl-ACP methyl ester carboxylesterase
MRPDLLVNGLLGGDSVGTDDIDGIATRYYDDRGPGNPIVLIHGGHFGFFVPVTMDCFSENVAKLAGHGRVVAFDKLGQGGTDLPSEDEQWTFDAVVAHATRFIEQRDLRDVTVLGHSRGGLLALRLAIDLPARVRKLVVVSSATSAPVAVSHGTDMDFYDRVEASAPKDQGSAAVVRHYHDAQRITEGDLSEDYVQAAAQWMDSDKERAAAAGYRRNGEHWAPSLQRARENVHDHLRSIGLAVPTLVVWGRDDRSAPAAGGLGLFELIAERSPDASLHLINRAGHQVFRDQADSFNRIVGAFHSG